MNRRILLFLGAIIAIAVAFLRRRGKWKGVDIEVEEISEVDSYSPDDRGEIELEVIDGIGPAYARRLRTAGVADASDLAMMDSTDLARESGIPESRILSWIEQARERDDGE